MGRSLVERARGAKALVHDAVDFTVDIVEQSHFAPIRAAFRALGVFAAIRGVNRGVEKITDAGVDALIATGALSKIDRPTTPIAMRSDVQGSRAWVGDAVIGALNGVMGDALFASKNDLDMGMVLRVGDATFDASDKGAKPAALVFPRGARSVAIFVHGLAATEWCFCLDAETLHGDAAATFGALLARDLGIVPIFARYNSGRPIAANGELLANAIERLFLAQNAPIDDVVLIGHSMGGLVVRSACHHATRESHVWISRVRHAFYIGSPHDGATLEQLGHLVTRALGAIDHPGTRIPADILRRRSAGIRDLRGGLRADDVPLSSSIEHHFISSTVTEESTHAIGRIVGDAMVRVPSAFGASTRNTTPRRHEVLLTGIAHHRLVSHPDVYAVLKASLDARKPGA